MKHIIMVTAVAVALLSAPVASAQESEAPLQIQSHGQSLGYAGSWDNNKATRRAPGDTHPAPGPDLPEYVPGEFDELREGVVRRMDLPLLTPIGTIYDPCLEKARKEFLRAKHMAEALEKQAYETENGHGPGRYFARYVREQMLWAWQCLNARAELAFNELYGFWGLYYNGVFDPGERSVLGHCEFDCPEVRLTMPLGFHPDLEGFDSPTHRWLTSPTGTRINSSRYLTGNPVHDPDLRPEVPQPYN